MTGLDASIVTMVDTNPDAQYVVSESGELLHANRAALDMSGYTADELVGQTVEMLVPGRFQSMHVSQRTAFQASPHPRTMGAGIDLWLLKKDGSEIAIDASLAPITSETGPVVIATVRNITQRKLAEDNLAAQLSATRNELVGMVESVEELSARIEVPEQLNARQEKLDTAVTLLRWAIGVAVLMVAISTTVFIFQQRDDAQRRELIRLQGIQSCERINDQGGNHIELWSGVLDRSVAPPDETPEEEAVRLENEGLFLDDLHAKFDPIQCDEP